MKESTRNIAGDRVVLGLSGGVDSAVAALLLKQQGADVHALHMTNWDDDDGYCTAAEDLQDAREICAQLDVPLHHVNFAREYRDRVFSYFLNEYRVGRTPNPDVLCNREIKFGVFRTYAARLGARWLATGHYARTGEEDGQPVLLKARDQKKDQSYFLHAIATDALAETLFPLGDLTKTEVRSIARDHGLASQDKKDSTGICFIGERPFREFLSTYLPAQPGPIKTPDGRVVGEHVGLMYYTLGQRQGLGIGGRQDGSEDAWYVAAKQLDSNTLIAVQGDHPLLYSAAADVTEISWIGPPPELIGPLTCNVKVRYRQPDQACEVVTDGDRLCVRFDAPQRAVAPGQFAVFYLGERCLGGGVIEATTPCENTLKQAV